MFKAASSTSPPSLPPSSPSSPLSPSFLYDSAGSAVTRDAKMPLKENLSLRTIVLQVLFVIALLILSRL